MTTRSRAGVAARIVPGAGRAALALAAGVIAAALVLTVAACGEDGEEGAATDATTAVTETVPTETAETQAETETAAETETTALPGDPQRGLEVFNAQGCGNCHALAEADATGTSGPNLDEQLVESAERAGEPLPEFTRESIVNPDAFIAEGFTAGVMPQNFGEQLSDEELDDLVAFIVQSVRE